MNIERRHKVPVLRRGVVTALDPATQLETNRYIFQIPFMEGVSRGNSLTFLGQSFTILAINDASPLRGMELVSELG